MKLTAEQARDVVYEDSDLFGGAEPGTLKIVDNTRWSVIKEGVYKHKESGKYYRFSWSVGATEYQDEQPFEYDDFYEPQEVVLKEFIRYEWTPVF